MAMNDEETVALIAGGHTFGKTHGAAPADYVGAEPEAAPIEQQGLGWKQTYGTGKATTRHLRPRGRVDPDADAWDNDFFDILFGYEWELTRARRRHQWKPKNGAGDDTVPDATTGEPPSADADHRPGAAHGPGLREDLAPLPGEPRPVRGRLRPRLVQAHPPRHGTALALPRPEVPAGGAALAGPDPGLDRGTSDADIAAAKQGLADSGLTVQQLVKTAWAAASSFRGSDKRGGANGGRIRLAPQRTGRSTTRASSRSSRHPRGPAAGTNISLADLIVLAGNAGVEQAAKAAGVDVTVPFTPGRGDATQEQTDVESFRGSSRRPTASAP
jgi:catalase-peroxidase